MVGGRMAVGSEDEETNACESAGAHCRTDGECIEGETRIRSACTVDGAVCCLADDGQDLCADWYYQTCTVDADCAAGYRCGEINSGCTAGSCQCDPTTGTSGVCTRDCRRGVGLCEPCPASGCDRPVPIDCTDAGTCTREGAWCESAERPECWQGGAPVCYLANHPISEDRCDTGCAADQDCPVGNWCRPTAQSGANECTPFQGLGGSCGGFVDASELMRCDPSLHCSSRSNTFADLPGVCRSHCTSDADCPLDDYCAQDGVCREDASCLVDADCNASGNTYVHAFCVGTGVCSEGIDSACGWSCDQVLDPPIRGDRR